MGADQNDYDLQVGTVYNLSTSGGPRNITGIKGGTEGRVIQLVNVGVDYIYLINEGTASLANDRILSAIPGAANFQLAPNQSIFLSYNNAIGRWLIMHSSVLFDPETDIPTNMLLGGARPFRRSGGFLSQTQKNIGQNKAEARGTAGNQTISSGGYTDITGSSVSFSLLAPALVTIAGRLSAYAQADRSPDTTFLYTTALDVDGVTYVLGTCRGVLTANISGGASLDIHMVNGKVTSALEFVPLGIGSHTVKLKMKRTGNDITVESVSDAPSVVTATW